jgi:hypothetical protein
VGEVRGVVFYKTVHASAHFLQKPRAIAFDVSTLHDAESAGAQRVEVTDAETGKTYTAALATIWQNGFALNRGHGAQQALLLSEFNQDHEQAEQLGLFAAG